MMNPTDPLALSFANARTSVDRDRIDTMRKWRGWVEHWPSLWPAARAVDKVGLLRLGLTRDHTQQFLRSYAFGVVDQTVADGILLRATSGPAPNFRWRNGEMNLFAEPPTAADMLGTYLARAAIDILASRTALKGCEGDGCLKTFVATRSDRRWCDAAVCGNRARVRAHHVRRGST